MEMAKKAWHIFNKFGEERAISFINDLATERFCGQLQPHAVFPDGSIVVLYPKLQEMEFSFYEDNVYSTRFRKLETA